MGLILFAAAAGAALTQPQVDALAARRMAQACADAVRAGPAMAETCSCMQREAAGARYPDLHAMVAETMRERYKVGVTSRINRPVAEVLRDDYGIAGEHRIAPVWASPAFARLKTVCRPR